MNSPDEELKLSVATVFEIQSQFQCPGLPLVAQDCNSYQDLVGGLTQQLEFFFSIYQPQRDHFIELDETIIANDLNMFASKQKKAAKKQLQALYNKHMLQPCASVPQLDKTIKNMCYGDIQKLKEKSKSLQIRVK